MKNLALGLICTLLLAACTVSFSPNNGSDLPDSTEGTPQEQAEAAVAARRFLEMIDLGDYEGTWGESGPALRAMSSEFAWKNTLKLTRAAFSAPPRREIEGFGFSTKIDHNVPVGEYVLVQFRNVSGKLTTTEKVVMQKDQSRWKIVGYFVTKRAVYGTGA